MDQIKKQRRILISIFSAFFSVVIALQPLVFTALTTAQGSPSSSELDNQSPEDIAPTGVNEEVDSLSDLGWLATAEGNLDLTAEDINAISDGKVDTRITDYLIYLVTPTEMGGAGFAHIKASRIVKNYSSSGTGKLDRETLEALKEDNGLVSAHNSGQAVDISEVGSVTCKLVERRHLGGNKTNWQAPTSVEVAWQSRDGIVNSPTPSGQSLMDASADLTAEAMMQYLNSTGELDNTVNYVKGLNLETILTYVGGNIFQKHISGDKVTNNPLANDLISYLGANYFQQTFPGLEGEIVAGNPEDDIQVAVTKARIESLLNLPSGSLRKPGWSNILDSTGKRLLERGLGLPNLYFDDKKIDDALSLPTVKAALNQYRNKDGAFNTITGTIDLIEQKNPDGFLFAGVNMLSGSLKLSQDQKKVLEAAVRQKKEPTLDLNNAPVTDKISSQDLANYFKEDKESQKKAETEMKKKGLSLLSEAAKKVVPKKYDGITQALLDKIVSVKGAQTKDVIKDMGASKLASQIGIDTKHKDKIVSGNDEKINTQIAAYLSRDLNLPDSQKITSDDVKTSIKGKNFTLFSKIGGAQADKALGWNEGTGFQFISGKISLPEAMGQTFYNKYGEILGLERKGFSLSGNITNNYGSALIEERLGVKEGSFKDGPDVGALAQSLGPDAFTSVFGISPASNNPDSWDNQDYIDRWNMMDLNLGIPLGSTLKYLQGAIDGKTYIHQTGKDNTASVTLSQIWNQFDLEDSLKLDEKEAVNLLNVLQEKEDITMENQNQALASIYKILGRSIGTKAGYSLDALVNYFTSTSDEQRTSALLNQGVSLFIKGLGIKSSEFTEEEIGNFANFVGTLFNMVPDDSVDYNTFRNTVTNFVLRATEIPTEFKQDAEAFASGDFKTGLAGASFVVWTNQINDYLPTGSKLDYKELRDGFIYDDAAAISARMTETALANGVINPVVDKDTYDLTRKQIMQENQKRTEYKISDAFLRKADPTIPVGFSEAFFSGDASRRGEILQQYVANHIDQVLKGIDPAYVDGAFSLLAEGKMSAEQAEAVIGSVLKRSGVSFGSFSNEFLLNFYNFTKSSNKSNFYSNSKYDGMWNFFDRWIENNLNIGGLPIGVSKSIYYASQNGWNADAGIVGSDGSIIVPSLNSLGEQFIVGRLTNWGDKQFGLPSGTLYQFYQALKGIDSASQALQLAKLSGNEADYAKASGDLSQAQAGLIMLGLTIALNNCAFCQQAFKAIDSAIAAPPGFTQAAALGAAAMALGLGPAGLIMAGVMYLTGTYRVDYLCPMPPADIYSQVGFDKDYDVVSDKTTYPLTSDGSLKSEAVKSSPKVGSTYQGKFAENPFDWDDGMKFVNGKNPELWMAWSRYFTGRLLAETALYGMSRESVGKPAQIITYRQANVEYFYQWSQEIFGNGEASNPRLGMGFTQNSTKTTDFVHISFGGYY